MKKQYHDLELHVQIIKITIDTDPRLNESLADFLVGILGMAVEVEVEDLQTVSRINGFLAREWFSDREIESICRQVKRFADEMSDIFGSGQVKVSAETVPDQDWSQNWKQFFKPFELVSGLMAVPSWEDYVPAEGEQVITIDPGMAFGTGHHATTKLCLQLMRDAVAVYEKQTVLDVGTGTGILAVAAVLWGADKAVAIDNDPEAVRVAGENIVRNDVSGRVDISGKPLEKITGRFPLVVANIIHDTLIALADDLSKAVAENGILIVSGLLHGEQAENIHRCFESRNLQVVNECREGEWSALKFKKIS